MKLEMEQDIIIKETILFLSREFPFNLVLIFV